MTLQEKITRLNELGVSWANMAKYVGCSYSALSKYAKNQINYSREMAEMVEPKIESLINDFKAINQGGDGFVKERHAQSRKYIRCPE